MVPSADRAIAILSKIQETCGIGSLAYWVLPNVILTLSGARAYCDGVYWSDSQKLLKRWDQEIKASVEAVRSITTVIASSSEVQTVRDNETYASFEIILKDGLQYVFDQTSLLGQQAPLITKATPTEDVNNQLAKALHSQDRFKDYDHENTNHVAFGILVGYPDKAIAESVMLWKIDDPFMEPLIDADIRGAGYYICPQPIYSYPRHLVNNPEINTHEQLWSQILKDYYTSPFHKQLETNSDFIAKMDELKNFR